MTAYASNHSLRVASTVGAALTSIGLILDLADFTVLRSKIVLRPPLLALTMGLLVVILALSLSLRTAPSAGRARNRLAILCWLCVLAAFGNLVSGGGGVGDLLPLVIVFFGFRAGQSLLQDMRPNPAPGHSEGLGRAETGS
jgi:hypothetical protein